MKQTDHEQITCTFISDEVIENEAISLAKYYELADEIPFPIEELVEFELGIEVVVLDGLYSNYDTSGFFSADFKRITVDGGIERLERLEPYRFTLAHEVGHLILHRSAFEKLNYGSIREWKTQVSERIDDKNYAYFETQANKFAKYLLMPTGKLVESAYPLIDKALGNGFEIPVDYELICEYIAPIIAKNFQVSQDSAKWRLLKEKRIIEHYR